MTRDELLESFAVLYLRLNGYFTTGLIVHSDDAHAGNQSEVDVLAIRFPQHRQPDRLVPTDQCMRAPDNRIDVVIVEVKSGVGPLQFNRGLRESADAIAKVLRWVGLFDDRTIEDLVPKVQTALAPNGGGGTQAPIEANGAQVRGVLFAPDRGVRRANQPLFVGGAQMMAYIRTCLSPPAPRPACVVRYDFGLWGQELEPIVRYFKGRQGGDVGGVDDLVRGVLGPGV